MSLKLRVDIALQLNDGVLFRTRRFVPDYRYTQSFLGIGLCEELVILDITRQPTPESRERFLERAAEISLEACTPAVIGGNIRTIEEVAFIIRNCGEGVILGRAARDSPELISEIAMKYGSQACTVAIDFLPDGKVRCRGEEMRQSLTVVECAVQAVALGAGQILLTSIDRDGSLEGYDVRMLASVAREVSVPVMIAGGCGNAGHMREAFAAGASACVTSNIFHMSESGMVAMHEQLAAAGVNVRSFGKKLEDFDWPGQPMEPA